MPAAGQLKKSITAPADLDRNSCLWFPDRVWVAVASSPVVAWVGLLPCALVVIGAVGRQHVAPAFVLHDPALLLAALAPHVLVRSHVDLVFVLRVAVPVRLRLLAAIQSILARGHRHEWHESACTPLRPNGAGSQSQEREF